MPNTNNPLGVLLFIVVLLVIVYVIVTLAQRI